MRLSSGFFENDQQSGFRLDSFSRLTHSPSSIIVFCLLYSTSYPVSRSPSDVVPRMYHPTSERGRLGKFACFTGDLHLSHAEYIFLVHLFLGPDCMLRVVAMELRRR